jgi:hypothetical protein
MNDAVKACTQCCRSELNENCRQIDIFRFPTSTVMTVALGRQSGGRQWDIEGEGGYKTRKWKHPNLLLITVITANIHIHSLPTLSLLCVRYTQKCPYLTALSYFNATHGLICLIIRNSKTQLQFPDDVCLICRQRHVTRLF